MKPNQNAKDDSFVFTVDAVIALLGGPFETYNRMEDIPTKLRAIPNMNPREWSVVARNIYQVDRDVWTFYLSAEALRRQSQSALPTLPNEIARHITSFLPQQQQPQLRRLTYKDDALAAPGGGGSAVPILVCQADGIDGICQGNHADASAFGCRYHQRWKDAQTKK